MSSRRSRRGGDGDPDDVQPVVEVLAETARLHVVLDVPVRGRHDAHVDGHLGARADAPDLALLQDAQELHLGGESQLPDLVEKDRPALRVAEETGPARDRPGEGALLVAEELRLDERLGHRSAVDDEERLLAAVARVVDRAGDALLAGAALARDEHGRAGAGDALRQVEDAAHAFGPEDDLAALLAPELRPEDLVLRDDVALLERLADQLPQLVRGERLRDEVVGAALHRVDRHVEGAVRGHHDDLGARRALLDERQEIHPAAVRHHQVREHDAVGLGRVHHRVAGGLEARCEGDVEAFAPEEDGQHVAKARLVVDDEDAGLRGGGHLAGRIRSLQLDSQCDLGRDLGPRSGPAPVS